MGRDALGELRLAWSTKSSGGFLEYSIALAMAASKAATTLVPSDAEQ